MIKPQVEVICPYCNYEYHNDRNRNVPDRFTHSGDICPSCGKAGSVYPPYTVKKFILVDIPKTIKVKKFGFFGKLIEDVVFDKKKMYVDDGYMDQYAKYLKFKRVGLDEQPLQIKSKSISTKYNEFAAIYSILKSSNTREASRYIAIWQSLIDSMVPELTKNDANESLVVESLQILINEGNKAIANKSLTEFDSTVFEVIQKRTLL